MEVLALIPARGGSKAIPRKNMVAFLGRPLVEWSVMAALEATTVTRTIISTDDEEIADCARRAGAEVPFLRPAALAEDDTPDHPVFVHTLEWLAENESYHPDLIVHLRPTTPLRPLGLIDQGVAIMAADSEADSLRAVCVPENNPFKMWWIEGGYMTPLVDIGMFESFNQPRQSLPNVYWQTGTVDITRPRTILEMDGMSGKRILPLVIDQSIAVDIDDENSMRRAEEKFLAYDMGSAV